MTIFTGQRGGGKTAAMKAALPALLARLAPVVYPTLREEYTPDCCIAAAAILIRVFDHFGYKASAVPVTVHVVNAAMVKLLQTQTLPDDPRRRKMVMDLTGAWGVGIVPASAELSKLRKIDAYGGHLLVEVENYLVDATLQQAQRPEKQILLPAMLATEHARELKRDRQIRLAVGECVVDYDLLDDESYRTAPDWTRRSTPFPETVRRIVARVEASQ